MNGAILFTGLLSGIYPFSVICSHRCDDAGILCPILIFVQNKSDRHMSGEIYHHDYLIKITNGMDLYIIFQTCKR